MRLELGTFVRPAEETGTGTPGSRRCWGTSPALPPACCSWTPASARPATDTEAWYRPRRIMIEEALHAVGLAIDDVDLVVNCHLHFDHIGGNPVLGGQPDPLSARRARHRSHHRLHGARIWSTSPVPVTSCSTARPRSRPASTSSRRRATSTATSRWCFECDDGSIVLAGQSHDTASQWSADALAARAAHLGHEHRCPGESVDVPAAGVRSQAGRLRPRRRRLAPLKHAELGQGFPCGRCSADRGRGIGLWICAAAAVPGRP